jgi:hypothetical protein
MKIHGKEAVKLNLMIDCNHYYWIDAIGDIWEFNDQSPYAEPKPIIPDYADSSKQYFVNLWDGNNCVPWELNRLRYESKAIILKAKQDMEQSPEPPKQFIIAKKVGKYFESINEIYTDHEALVNDMEEFAKGYPGTEFVKLIVDTSVIAKCNTTYEVTWK